MELQELKNIWNRYDKTIDNQIKVDYDFLKKISLEKTKSMLFNVKFEAVVEIIMNMVLVPPVMRFSIQHISTLKYALPGLLLALVLLLTLAWNIYSLVLFATLNYRLPIVTIQKRLEGFKIRDGFRQKTLLWILYPVCQTAFLIIFCKAVINVDLYEYPKFLIGQFIFAVVMVPVTICIIKASHDKKLDEALLFLNDLKEFEKD